ncbi:glycoside hydrolase family 3 N-terminal domain-containing protein [Pollutibacter soli]|uniref:glycoside hydrolase family 3 N-terminal domain-containing protein n=1 Tax=Pollutibacter soli TaxID=3034157 RepID=UPI003013D8CB
MKSKILLLLIYIFSVFPTIAQTNQAGADAWADSVFASLSDDQKIAQLMIVRLSSINTRTREITFYDEQVRKAVTEYNVGGICLFQGNPVKQALLINEFQKLAKTPIMISIDGENGIGMRMDSVQGLPRQMMMGAVTDSRIIYNYGRWVGEQCKRMGIQVNYAPVVDINNNPDNPVINDRSFGEDKNRVAAHGIAYMRGMQDVGILACAKHFPGHGDVSVDSHYDLPVINKSKAALDSLELYPFKALIDAGVGSAMIAHLYIPAIDNTENRATSISEKTVTGVLRNELGFKGLTFTDALEMKGVAKYFPDGQAAVESLIAGNDMLCLPGDVPVVLHKIKEAIRRKRITMETVDLHVKKVLRAKYLMGLNKVTPVVIEGLTRDLNTKSASIRELIAENAVTLARYNDSAAFPIPVSLNNKIALVSIGTETDNAFSKRLRRDYNADVFHFSFKQPAADIPDLMEKLGAGYKSIVISLHKTSRFPAGNFGLSQAAVDLVRKIGAEKPSVLFAFGNPYTVKYFCDLKDIIVCYEDEPITHDIAADVLNGRLSPRGKLPVTVCSDLPSGTGLGYALLPPADPFILGIAPNKLTIIDSLAEDAIRQQATPGCVVLVAKNGRLAYYKNFGYYTYDSTQSVSLESLYDMASVTKICATTLSVMKLYDQGKIKLDKKLGDYLPWVRGSDKQNLVIGDILLHQARLKSFIPFYQETLDPSSGQALSNIYARRPNDDYSVHVADSFYMAKPWLDTIRRRILASPLEKPGTYVYSDNDFIFLGKIVEEISGLTLDQFVQKEFYRPLGLVTAGFNPRQRFDTSRIAPTEKEKIFRNQLIRGYVHDPGAAMLGGVSGHAGLFSNAYDIAVLMQLLLNHGKMNGIRLLSDSTIRRFTAYSSDISRRGLGFDKPEKDNATRPEPYPTLSTSPLTFGHTGFTGTCVWVDPKTQLIYVFLSNRVYPDGRNKLLKMNVRSNIHEAIYKSMQ